MKKHFLTCALALCMAFLCACGGGESGSQGGGTAAEPLPAAPAPGEPEEPEPVPEPEKLEGLIFASGMTIVGYDESQTHFEIRCFQPETEKESLISQFDLLYINGNDYYQLAAYERVNRDLFSDDYSKIAVTKHFVSSGETHAGWIDSDGSFFDVTEALGLQSKSGSESPASYNAMGFSDNLFGYYQYTGKPDPPCYWVPINNVTSSAICEGDVFTRNGQPDESSITSWIDDTRYIVNINFSHNHWNSQILDRVEDKTREYIPGNSRNNRDGFVSPDGTQIAFMSAPEGCGKVTNVYIIPVEGGDPVKVTGCSFVLSDLWWSIQDSNSNQEAGSYILIDWK